MDSQDGKIIVSRHGKKYSGTHGKNKEDGGEPAFPGSLEDKSFIYITPESGEELMERGKEILGDQTYDNVLLMTSDFIRALQSAVYFISGANKPNGQHIDQRPEIGFSLDNVNWRDPKVPRYSDDKEVADVWIKTLLEKFYFRPEEPGLPFMGNMMYHFYNSLVDGIKYLQQNRGQEQNILAHFTHTPNVDTFVNMALDCLVIDPVHQTVEVDTDKYKGAVEMGEMFTGNIFNLQSDNPSIELDIKGVKRGFKLTDLENITYKVLKSIE